MTAFFNTFRIQQVVSVLMLHNVELLSGTQSTCTPNKAPTHFLQNFPSEFELFTSIFQFPNMVCQLTFCSMSLVVHVLLVNSESLFEGSRT